MSTYENYHRTSQVYDKTRTAGGIDIILKAMEEGILPLSEQVLLDAGCGTGLYSAALLNEVRRIEAVDLNAGMLGMAQDKLQAEEKQGRISFHQTAINSLPLPDKSVDAVMINQVLHHLPDDADSGWPEHKKVFNEFFRILKPGGRLIINSCSPEQLELGFWFYHLIPDAIKAVQEKTIALEEIAEQLHEVGFFSHRQEVPLDLILQDEAYFQHDGILDPDWRSGDSIWSLVEDKNLTDVLYKTQHLQKSGNLKDYMLKHDQLRKTSGQVTFTVAGKQF
ncbi:MAG: methyltransferase domain-containing protein [SAR324 cluster bacterium]|nr:methyltransferase domain-containing protein [SAR324 cluster bacterium]MBL7035358.1 methyltransferase domain-containing protein [SAR324 cluster bacterium]